VAADAVRIMISSVRQAPKTHILRYSLCRNARRAVREPPLHFSAQSQALILGFSEVAVPFLLFQRQTAFWQRYCQVKPYVRQTSSSKGSTDVLVRGTFQFCGERGRPSAFFLEHAGGTPALPGKRRWRALPTFFVVENRPKK